MLVTRYCWRLRGDEKAAILELTDDSGIKHPDTIELPDETIRQYSSAGMVRANEELKSAGPEDKEEDEEDVEDGDQRLAAVALWSIASADAGTNLHGSASLDVNWPGE